MVYSNFASVSRSMQDVNASNNEKNTPLHWACLNGKKEVVKALILAGATVSLLNSYERTPMDEAVARGEMQVVDAVSAAVAQAELQGVSVN
ncbi:Ankyrin repeat domain-containing protein 2 [Dendrobium catenatum]|uniref:Ankyrin repeat domain-containing protein 2 n=1 Tax=Dendrobium catenatum TaxID=906689 RepID=A0A2I0WD17_9ASPA|nr:Ankyrin repeat domain-containing protein 2 [Dendrobium catenatum]